jgi:glycosyltransferase involved in cell wall biosynthesis
VRRVLRRIGQTVRLLRHEGIRRTTKRILLRLATSDPILVLSPMVSRDDMIAVDWTNPPEHLRSPVKVGRGPIEVAWITSPPSEASGGHHNVFRFIKVLEQAGHRCTVYLYDWQHSKIPMKYVHSMIHATEAYPDLSSDVVAYDRSRGVDPKTQAIVATAWETAYPAYLDKSTARRFYFVQDFEPSFYPVGSASVLAENTYRFGFRGLTAGEWLAYKLHADYGMVSDAYDFGVDTRRYFVTNTEERRDVFFYARSTTPRRGFDLGVAALSHLATARPDVTIHFAGTSGREGQVPFRHVDHHNLGLSALNDLYNRCAAGLVLSLTNMSLLPLELIASGVTPVMNDAPNNRMVSESPFIAYVPLSPRAVAERLIEIVDRPDNGPRATSISRSVAGTDWGRSGEQFVKAFERAMRG